MSPREHAVQVRGPRRDGMRVDRTTAAVLGAGHGVAHLVTEAVVHVSARSLPTVTLDLGGVTPDVDLEAAHVDLVRETRELLVRLGWTPPGGGEPTDAEARTAASAAMERMADVFARDDMADMAKPLRAWSAMLGDATSWPTWLEAARALLGARSAR